MTREEEIERASVHHLNQYDYSYEEGEHLDFYIKGFTEGAKWADEHPNLKSLWHDVSEEPKGDYFILCDGLGNLQWAENFQHIDMYYANWKDYADAFKVNRWAYISDLLPKGGKK